MRSDRYTQQVRVTHSCGHIHVYTYGSSSLDSLNDLVERETAAKWRLLCPECATVTITAKPIVAVLVRNPEGTYDRMRADDPRAQAIVDALGSDGFIGVELESGEGPSVWRDNGDGTVDRLHASRAPGQVVIRYELVFWDGSAYTTLVPSGS